MNANQMKDMAAFAAKRAKDKSKPVKGKCPDCGKPKAKCDC